MFSTWTVADHAAATAASVEDVDAPFWDWDLSLVLEAFTALSTIIALFALVYQVRQSRHERSRENEISERERAEAAEEHRAAIQAASQRQALLIAGWVTVPAQDQQSNQESSIQSFDGVVKNSSDLPIYELTGTLVTHDGQDYADTPTVWKVGTLPPGDERSYKFLAIRPKNPMSAAPKLKLEFTDSAKRVWTRLDLDLSAREASGTSGSDHVSAG